MISIICCCRKGSIRYKSDIGAHKVFTVNINEAQTTVVSAVVRVIPGEISSVCVRITQCTQNKCDIHIAVCVACTELGCGNAFCKSVCICVSHVFVCPGGNILERMFVISVQSGLFLAEKPNQHNECFGSRWGAV